MAAENQPLDIAKALSGERIFITGATGFLGKVLVEKLLWAVPEVGKLVLLVRSDGERAADERLAREVLAAPLFARLRALHGDDWAAWAESKVEVVAGDLGRDSLGLTPTAYTALVGRIDRVVACGATVTFDERLDRALEFNTRGALRMLELARDAGSAPLLHVSTCFVSGCRQGSISEVVAGGVPGTTDTGAMDTGAADDLDEILAALDSACWRSPNADDPAQAQVAAGAEMAARYGFNDVYTLTKALAERLLVRAQGAVPLAILRPAIVESAVREPLAGWIDGVRVADPLLVAYGRGKTRTFPGRAGSRLDIVPVDHVVNAMIAALADLPPSPMSGRPRKAPAVSTVYQLTSSRRPLSLGEWMSSARRGFAKHPLRDDKGLAIPVPAARFIKPRSYQRRLERRRGLAAYLADRLGSSSLGRRAAAAERTLGHYLRLFAVYQPYIDHQAVYEDSETRALWARLNAHDRELFGFDIEAMDWAEYVERVHVPGLARYALRAENGAPPPPAALDAVAAGHAAGHVPAAGATTVFELLAIAAREDPSAIAFQTCRDGSWLRYTYGEAETATANIAARLARSGVRRGDRVALWGSASPEWVLTSFAVHRLGAVTVPLDPQWPVAEVLAAAEFTGARRICVAPGLAAELADCELEVSELAAPFVPEPGVGLLPGSEYLDGAGAGDVATILFTSGTTVAPKAVPLTHDNLLSNVRDLVPVMQSSRERLLSVLPIHHVFEFTVGLLVPLAGGGTISYLAELKPEEIRWMMNATRPTMLVAVPRLLELLHNGIRQNVASGGAALRGLFRGLFAVSRWTGGRYGRRLFGKVHSRFGGELRRIASGGAALDPELGRSFRWMGFAVAEGYGMTETSPVLTVNPWAAIRFGSVGRPLPGVEVEVRPESAALEVELPEDAALARILSGEVWVRGASVMGGYFGNPEANAEVMRGGWLNTGDVGYLDDDGYLHLNGRTKDVIVTAAGKNVFPEEVERRYAGVEGVEELVILGLPAPSGGELVTAVVVPRTEAGADDEAVVRAAFAERSRGLPSYQQVSRIEFWRGDLPKTTTMKVRRRTLRQALITGGSAAPQGGAELRKKPAAAENSPPTIEALGGDSRWALTTLATLTGVRAEALRPADRLAELGLDSLSRVELVAALESRLGLRLSDEEAAGLEVVGDLLERVTETNVSKAGALSA